MSDNNNIGRGAKFPTLAELFSASNSLKKTYASGLSKSENISIIAEAERLRVFSSEMYSEFLKFKNPRISAKQTNPNGVSPDTDVDEDASWVAQGFKSQLDCVLAMASANLSMEAWVDVMKCDKSDSSQSEIHIRGVNFKSKESSQGFLEFLYNSGYRYNRGRVYKFNELNNITGIIQIGESMVVLNLSDDQEYWMVLSELDKAAYLKTKQAKLTTVTGISPRGLEVREEDITESSVKLADATFYPWMDGMSVHEYFSEFMQSDASVLVLYGLLGTGKSTFVQTGIVKLGLSALICADAAVSSNPEFVSKLGAQTDVENGQRKFDMIVVEDGDALMRPRSEGNLGLNALLSATDGIGTKGKFKLVVTTNAANVHNIDSALLRPGRCFDRMEFGKLAPAYAINVRKALNLSPFNFTESAILASVLNADVTTVTMGDGDDSSIVSPRFPLKK